MWSEALWNLMEIGAGALLFGVCSVVGCVWLAALNRHLQAESQSFRVLLRVRSFSQMSRFLIQQLRSAAIDLDRCARRPGYQKLGLLCGYLAGVGLLTWLPLWPTTSSDVVAGSVEALALDGDLFVLWCVVCLIGMCRVLGQATRDRHSVVWTLAHSWVLCLAFLEVSQTAGTSSVMQLVSYQASSGLWIGMTQPIAAVCCTVSLLALTSLECRAELSNTPDRTLIHVREPITMLHTIAASYVIVLVLLGGGHVWGVHGDSSESAAGLMLFGVLVLHLKLGLVAWMMIRIRNRWGRLSWMAVRGRILFSDACCRVLPAVALGSWVLASAMSYWPRLDGQHLLKATIGWLLLTVMLGGLAAGRGSSMKELTL